MSIAEFLSSLREQGILLWVEDDHLRYTAPKETITPDLKTELLLRKTEITAFLRESENVNNSSLVSINSIGLPKSTISFTAPSTLVENLLINIWSQVLMIEQVSIHDNYFELGGDSLLAMQIIARANQVGLSLTPKQIFEHQTIKELAVIIDGAQTTRAEIAPSLHPPIKVVNRDGNILLSFAQQRLWILDQLEPAGATAYTIFTTRRLRGLLKVEALEQALGEIVRRHEVLRATFVLDADGPVQKVARFQPVSLVIRDLEGLPETEQEEQLRQLVSEAIRQPFDLAKGPLFRAILFRITEDDQILLITMHHIVSDGWSLTILHQELITLYNAFARGEASPLAELPIQYIDYAAWQREWLQGDMLDEQLAYWKQRLAGASLLLELPTDHPRPAAQTFRGARQEFQFPLSLSEELRELSQQAGATMFMLLLAGLQTLLYRYTHQDDFCIGMPTAGRPNAQVEALIGFFVNTLVFRAEMAGDPTFLELLMRVRQQALETYSHQDLPFEQLVDALQVQRDLSHSPLFQVMLAFQNLPREQGDNDLQWSGLTRQSFFVVDNRATMFDLTLYVWDSPDGLRGNAEYNADLFDGSTITRLLGHFQILLGGIVANPGQKLSVLPMITGAEREQILVEWNDTKAEYPQDKCIHELFEEQVRRTPDAIAVVFEEQQLTYRELNKRANQLAHYLRSLGVGPEKIVGVCLDRCIETLISLLAIFKSGGVYIPLDPGLPTKRLDFMMTNSQVMVVLTKTVHRFELDSSQVQFVQLDQDEQIITQQPHTNPDNQLTPKNLAYIIYTSGSTGTPKGVIVEQQGMVNHLYAKIQALNLTKNDSIAATAPPSFDISIWQFLAALLVGGTTCILNNETIHHPAKLLDMIEKESISILEIIPSLLHFMIDELTTLGPDKPEMLAMRWLLLTGEALPPQPCQEWFTHYPDIPLMNAYGPTECSDDVAHHSIYKAPPVEITIIPIGRPVANMKLYILDVHLQPTIIGIPGELYVEGDGVGRGYLNDPQRTAANFIPNPFGNGRLYKTGDLARYLLDGNIEFLGRIDHQVKIRGFRIELGEIEAVLGQHPAVQQVMVVARTETTGQQRLVAYLTVSDNLVPELRDYLKQKLPDYMVPSAFVVLDHFPLTPNGKIDRKALPAPDGGDRTSMEKTYVAPHTATEELLAGVWMEVLHVEQVSVHDNFFEIGGDSLLALLVIGRARKIGLLPTLLELFEYQTIAKLAAIMDTAQVTRLEIPPIGPFDRISPFLPLSFAQQRLWILNQLEPEGATAYTVPVISRLKGWLNVEALKNALTEIVRRHEVLRTTFTLLADQPIQIVDVPHPVSLPIHDLRSVSLETEREDQLLRLISEEICQPFDLSKGPLFKAVLFKVTDENQVLLITMHHIVSDGWSLSILRRELITIYNAFVREEQSPLMELPIQYADYAAWQRGWLQGEALEVQLTYWKQRLANISPLLDLPTDRPRPPAQTFLGARQGFQFPAILSVELKTLSQQAGATMFMLLLAALQTLLYRYTHQDDFCIGTPNAGRPNADIETLIGFFVNTLVFRAEMAGDPTFLELVRRVREQALETYRYQDLPFEQLVDALHVERDLSRSPLFQIMLAFQNLPREEGDDLQWSGLTRQSFFVADSRATMFDLTLFIWDSPQGLRGLAEYNTGLFDASTIARLLGHFEVLLEGIVSNPGHKLSALPVMSKNEREQVLVEWNDTKAEYGHAEHKCLHELFEEQAQRTPDAVAVAFDEQQLSYQELNKRSNQLAHYLRSLGVGPDVLVGICVERSLEMIVGLLGILKAGGAYVPLDPTYPQERLEFMLEDSGVSVLLTLQHLNNILPLQEYQVVVLDDWKSILSENNDNLENQASAQDLSYVIYTSGSTGLPKGVQIQHHSVVNFLVSMQDKLKLNQDDVLLSVTTLSFDIAGLELFLPLSLGAKVVIASRTMTQDPSQLAQALTRHQATVMQATPITWQMLSISGWQGMSGLKMLCGGEALSRELAQSLLNKGGQLWNLYGPTETTIWSTLHPVTTGDRKVLIGHPIANTQTYILDAQLRPVPVGVVGELYISGVGVARGYLKRAELTGEKFLPDPFSIDAGARMYRTGDQACWRADGNIEYLGRIDQQVKIRGFRIELGEIETVLNQHPGVQSCVVQVREDIPGSKQLVAYIVSKTEHTLAATELRSFLKDKLPEYMLPAVFIMLNQMPLTPNGKLDRKALPAPTGERPELSLEFVAPRTVTEELLAGIWSGVLGMKQVSIYDDFFALGGDSLLALRVISRVGKIGLSLTPKQLFEHKTVAKIAAAIDFFQSKEIEVFQLPPIKSLDHNNPLPVSFAQQRFWILDQLMLEETSAYTIPMLNRFSGPLNVDALHQAITEVVRRHEVLRTTFDVVDGEPVQIIATPVMVPLNLIDLQNIPEDQQEKRVRDLTSENIQKPFDLRQGPLYRVILFRLADQDHVLQIVVHHSIFDGWSLEILWRELSAIYDAYSCGELSPLEELSVQYADYAVWQRNWLQGEILEKQLAYWKTHLKDAPSMLQLPTDYPRPIKQTHHGRQIKIQFSLSLDEKIRKMGQQHGVTSFMILLTALKIALFNWAQQNDIVVGTVLANRNQPEVEQLIGCFLNFLAIRSKVSREQTALSLLTQIRTTLLESYPYHECPFEKVVDVVNPLRELSHNPIYNVGLLFQNQPWMPFAGKSLEQKSVSWEETAALLDLRFIAYEGSGGTVFSCEYNTDLFRTDTIEHLIKYYCEVLTRLVEFPETCLEQFTISEPLERQIESFKAREQTILISATYTAEPIREVLTFWLEQMGLPWAIEFSGYNQVFQQLLDSGSALSINKRGINMVLVRFEDWLEDSSQPIDSVTKNVDDFINAVQIRSKGWLVPCILCMCAGSRLIWDNEQEKRSYKELEKRVQSGLVHTSGVYVISSDEIEQTYPVEDYYDQSSDELGHMPYTSLYYSALGTILARKVHTLQAAPVKVIVLDCDQTLWKGICGEVGASGVEVDLACETLQKFVGNQYQAGKLICLCSKNNEDDVWEVFDQHPGLLLRREQIAAWRINWRAKSENIQSLAQELNLGLESFVFIDDDPMECAEVQASCPEVITLQLPKDSRNMSLFLKNLWVCDQASMTDEDRKRTELYQQNVERLQYRKQALTLAKFISGLELKIRIFSMEAHHINRVAQLTQRTNQFNMSCRRWNESEVQQLDQAGMYECLVIEVSDRFGDYGVVGAVFYAFTSGILRVKNFMLSCRVLGRGVEHHVVAKLGEIGIEYGAEWVELDFIPSPKNRPALEFLEKIGENCSRSDANVQIYRIRSINAASLSYQPENSAIENLPHTTVFAQSQIRQLNPSEKYTERSLMANQIAHELNSAEAILKTIEAHKHNHRSELQAEMVAPRTLVEEKLAQIWSHVLGLKQVGIYDNFFALGGDSLLALRVISRVCQIFQLELSVYLVFEYPTIAQMTTQIGTQPTERLLGTTIMQASDFAEGDL